MKDRRPLLAGLKAEANVDRSVEEHFVATGKPNPDRPKPPSPAPELPEGKGPSGNPLGRVPLTTRVRADYSAALKRASLQRQLAGVVPNTLQDILEQALEPWLRSNGYLD
jgi:hypothetical protein